MNLLIDFSRLTYYKLCLRGFDLKKTVGLLINSILQQFALHFYGDHLQIWICALIRQIKKFLH